MNDTTLKVHRQIGAVMSEFVLILPMIIVILALLFYFGHLVIRAEHTITMARYETWRRAAGAPGPYADDATGSTLLNQTFLANRATTLDINDPTTDHYFPNDPYELMIDSAQGVSPSAGDIADAFLYWPNGNHRNSRGRRVTLSVTHEDTVEMWNRITSIARRDIANPEQTPLRRRHTRIGTDWSYTNDWRASADRWADTSGGNRHHLQAVRDVFFADFDTDLDAIDGDGTDEPNGSPYEYPNHDALAGQVRELYLANPGYEGPTVPITP